MLDTRKLGLFREFEGGEFVKPIYQDFSFANIAPTVYFLLAGKRIGSLLPKDCFGGAYPRKQKIVLFLIDSFSWVFWEKYYHKFKFLERVSNEGVVTPISALFPSTTAAAVSTVLLGVLPSKHGLLEWNLYIPEFDLSIQTLPFTPMGEEESELCLELGFSPTDLYLYRKTFHVQLQEVGIKSYQLLHEDIATTAVNKILSHGAEVVSFTNLAEGLIQLRDILARSEEPLYIYFYWDKIDSIAHTYGPGSAEHEREIAHCWEAFEKVFGEWQKSDDTLFLFTADHGQVKADPAQTFYLNREVPEIVGDLRTYSSGQPIYPSGSPRDVFLYVREGEVEKVYRILTKKLKGIGKVMLTSEALEEGFFGPPPYSEGFLARLGQILILVYKGQYVWWFEEGKLEVKLRGNHGGMSRDEMVTILASW